MDLGVLPGNTIEQGSPGKAGEWFCSTLEIMKLTLRFGELSHATLWVENGTQANHRPVKQRKGSLPSEPHS